MQSKFSKAQSFDDTEPPVVHLEQAAARAPEFSDESLALKFSARHLDNLRHVAVWNKWLVWDGTIWRFDDTMHVFNLSRAICRETAVQCNKAGTARAVASAKTVAAAVSLSRADRRLASTVDQWDVDPWLLNTPDGVVNLKSGKLRDHRREDYLTKITAVGPNDGCPQWLEFMRRVTDGDGDLEAFIQRMVGYTFTGVTREHALFFLYGTGANGKSVFTGTISEILGDYHRAAAMETFVTSQYAGHPTDLAGLRGARLVTAVETEEGRRWAESKIKALTGGDKIAARFMRRDFFEFVPEFKLVIAGNHKPGLRNVDVAMKRRLHLVPFTVTIPEDERDKNLQEKLKSEWPGILQWAIEGCLAWQERGLQPPESVRDATAEYLDAEDALALWIEECCVEGRTYTATTSDLFVSWKTWCDRTGEFAGSMKRFSQNLQDREYVRWQDPRSRRRGFRGLQAIKETSSDWTSP